MSVEAMGYVFTRSPMKGAAFAVHLAVADSVNDMHGNEFWMRTPKLAKKARVSRGAADRALTTLCDAGLLELVEEGKPGPRSAGAPRRFLFLMPELPVVYESRAQGATLGEVSRRVRDTSRAVCATPAARTSSSLSQGNDEPKIQEEPAEGTAEPAIDPLLGFPEFWEQYPKRNGKREGRGKTEAIWRRLSYEERKAAWRGACHYGRACDSGLTIAADSFRWLRDRRWEDWQDPATPSTAGPRRGMTSALSEAGADELLRQYGTPNGGPPPVAGRALPSAT